jgi:hypothetical protein
MTEMIERVAGVISKGLDGELNCNEWRARGLAYGLAIAAIKAMREPTEGMIGSTFAIMAPGDCGGLERRDARDEWQAMIDAAMGGIGDD